MFLEHYKGEKFEYGTKRRNPNGGCIITQLKFSLRWLKKVDITIIVVNILSIELVDLLSKNRFYRKRRIRYVC